MNYRSSVIIRLLKYAPFNKTKLFFASTCSILNKICDIVPEILIGISIDTIVNRESSIIANLGIKNPFNQLYFIGTFTAILWILESVFEYLYSISWDSLSQNVQHQLRLKLFSSIQNSDMSYFEDITTGELLNILKEDVNQLKVFLGSGINEIIQLIVNIIVLGLIFLYLSPMLAMLILLPIPFIIVIAYCFQRKLAYLYTKLSQASSSLSSHITYRLQGIANIKSYTTESYELENLSKENYAYLKANSKVNKVRSLYIPTVRLTIMFGFITCLVIGGIYTIQGKLPINWYAALVFLTQRFLWPFTSIANLTDSYQEAVASSRRILNIIVGKTITVQSGFESINLNNIKGAIVFNDVSFGYNNKQIFDAISFKIPAKKTIAFVGSTGSGKSTIVKLLLRFYDPRSGNIKIDEYDTKNLKLKDLRQSISLVSQHAYLVEGTIAQNIAYGTFEASYDSIVEAAKMACMHDFIMNLPKKYNTKVQEQGKNLSGGQVQRIAIARAILKKSPILVFDEATSAVDNETEAAIQQSMIKLKSKHTIIIIAHRLSAVRHADTIFVLQDGAITESGSHEELLAKKEAYAKLWNPKLNNINQESIV